MRLIMYLCGGIFLAMSAMRNCTSSQDLAHLSTPLPTLSLGLMSTLILRQCLAGFVGFLFFLVYVLYPNKGTGIN